MLAYSLPPYYRTVIFQMLPFSLPPYYRATISQMLPYSLPRYCRAAISQILPPSFPPYSRAVMSRMLVSPGGVGALRAARTTVSLPNLNLNTDPQTTQDTAEIYSC